MPSFVRCRLAWMLLFLLSCTGTGCLYFETEKIVFVFPPDMSEVRGLLIYEGIGVSGEKPDDLKKAKQQFSKFASDEQWFCFGDWFLFYTMEPEEDDSAGQKNLKTLVRKHFAVRNGGLYRNSEGKLCGFQTITVRDPGKFFDQLNGFVSPYIAEKAAKAIADPNKGNDLLDETSLKMIKNAADAQYKWLNLEPGRLTFKLPATSHAVRNVKKKWLVSTLTELRKEMECLSAPPPDEKGERALEQRRDDLRRRFDNLNLLAEYLTELPLGFEQKHDHVVVSLGFGNSAPIQITTPDHGQPLKFDDELLALGKERKVPFHEDLTTEKLVESFMKDKGVIRLP